MVYSIHTLEITLVIKRKSKFEELLDGAYKNAKSKHKLFEENGVFKDYALSKNGIDIEYHGDFRRKNYKKKIKFIINPSRVLGGNDLKLWKPNKKNISALLEELECCINDYFDSEYTLNDFILSRVDFTVNIPVGSKKQVSAYVKIFHNIGKVKGFSQKYSNADSDWYDKECGFDLEGNSNGIDFTVYDKEGALENQLAKGKKVSPEQIKSAGGILRIEVKLIKQKAIKNYTKETGTAMQITDLSKRSKEIFLETFNKIVPYGDFYDKKSAESIIIKNTSKKILRKKMLKLIDLVPKKKSLLLAQREMNERNIDKVMNAFAKLNLSPVTISKRSKVKHLPNLYTYLY